MMILTVDIGNTNIVLGGYEKGRQVFSSRMPTDRAKMRDQYAVDLLQVMRLYDLSPDQFQGAAISSVVPQLQSRMRDAVEMVLTNRGSRPLEGKILTVSPGMKTGLNIKIDNPAQLGSDMVCSSVAALAHYPLPSIVVDLGTATKISALDLRGQMIGCSIMPGVMIGLEALSARTAQLPQIDLQAPVRVIGTNTVDSMRSGIILGTASMIDGMAQRCQEELGEGLTVIATGGLAEDIVPYCRCRPIYNPNICLEGLLLIYEKNEKAGEK